MASVISERLLERGGGEEGQRNLPEFIGEVAKGDSMGELSEWG